MNCCKQFYIQLDILVKLPKPVVLKSLTSFSMSLGKFEIASFKICECLHREVFEFELCYKHEMSNFESDFTLAI